MDQNPLDCLIVGQGLAGTTLAWQALAAGLRVGVLDRGDVSTASRAAAGLITPVTGKRIVKSWRFDELHPVAIAFYHRIEAELGESIYHVTPMVRLFANEREREVYETREFADLTRKPTPPVDEEWFSAPLGGFEMPTAGRLDVPHYLDVSRTRFEHNGFFCSTDLDPAELIFDADFVRISRLGIAARRVIFCTGFDHGTNPLFRHLGFNAAKGEILTLRVPGLEEKRVINRGIWISPTDDGLFQAGATYEWDDLTPTPTAAGRDKLEARLHILLKRPFEVVGHRAGVRPISADRNPILGFHSNEPRIGCFTGLGSKGVLLAPFFAAQFVSVIVESKSIDPEVEVHRWASHLPATGISSM